MLAQAKRLESLFGPPKTQPPRPSGPVAQGVIVLKDQPQSPVNSIDWSTSAMLEVKYGLTQPAIAWLGQLAREKQTHEFDNWAAAAAAAQIQSKKIRLSRIKGTFKRNETGKAKPKRERFLLDLQKKHSYGYGNPDIQSGILRGSFRRGWGGQPFLSLNKKDFGGAVVGSDYDSLVKAISGDTEHSQQEIAEDILALIDHGTYDKSKYSKTVNRAISTLVQLTQVIESHGSRIPGTDKFARASLSRILNGSSTFHNEFNRKNGNFLPARAKSGGSRFGGQEATRALLEAPKPSHTAKLSDVYNEEVGKTLDELSDDSEDERDEKKEED
jgi:hypothetical protein